jgi:heptosyltransferase-2
MNPNLWDNVLVLQTSFLGDTVLTLPLLSEIKRRSTSTRLSLLCSPLGHELLRDHPGIDEIIIDDKKGRDKGLRGLWLKAQDLRKRGFTLALTPHKSLRTALMLYFARIPCRIGFRQSKGWFLFHHRVNRPAARHDVERNLSVLEAFGIESDGCERALRLPVSSILQDSVNRLMASSGVDLQKMIFGVNPGSVWPTKRWAPAGFAKLIELLKKRYECEILLFGGPGDREVADTISELCDGAAVNLAGTFGLRELPAALSLCRLLITNDSGPMHVAVARNVPTVAIFCATTPELGFYPYSADAIVIEKDLMCRPCSSHGGKRCPLGTEDCIRLVSPEKVFEAVRRLMERNRGPFPADRDLFKPEFVRL